MTEPVSSDVDPLVGRELDGFRIEGLLGAGGMGRVYKAYDTRLARTVAIKFLAGTTPELVQRFEREIRALSAVNHPNVAHIYSSGTYEDTPYYVLEYLDGGSLAQFLAPSRRLPGGRIFSFLQQAARGLAAAHARGIVHRDVKPSNLMLLGEEQIKVVDFGLARRIVGLERSLTETFSAIGTPHYMAPEQARGKGSDHRSDIYSLGATFYHLLAGAPPFDGETPLEILLQQVQQAPPPLRERNPRVPEALAAVIERMLAKSPEDRPQTYAELLEALEGVHAAAMAARRTATVLSVPVVTPSPTAAPARADASVTPAPSTASWLVPGALGLALLAILGILIFGRGRAMPAAAAPGTGAPESAPATAPASPLTDVLVRALGGAGSRGQPGAPPATPVYPGLPQPGSGIAVDPALYMQMAYRTKTAAAMRKIATAVEIYRAERDEPLFDLAPAVELAGLKRQELLDGWGRPIAYEALPDRSYRLRSAGPDGIDGDADDLVMEDGLFVQGDPSPPPPTG